MKLRKILLVPVVLIAGASAIPFLWQSRIDALGGHMENMLQKHGFRAPHIESVSYQNNQVAWTGITLDEDKFSTIRALQAPLSPKDILLGHAPQSVSVDSIKLTGVFTPQGGLTVSGWKQQPLRLSDWQQIILNGGQIDLDTPAGGLRLQAKGTSQRQADGVVKLQGLVWAVQNQLKLDAEINGVIRPNGGWSYDIQLHDGGINMKNISMSRASGWITLDNVVNATPAISSQIDAGKLTFGDLSFSNFNVTLQGPYNNYKAVAKGEIYGFEKMLATLDIQNMPLNPQIQASIETASVDDLIMFLKQLQASDTHAGNLTTLLITPGNLERLRREIAALEYDMLEIQVYGMLYDLAGKVIIKKYEDGVEQRQVISLDPGDG